MESYVKRVRAALGWTQEQMAAALGKSTSMVRFYERGAFVVPEEVTARVQEIARKQGLDHLAPAAEVDPGDRGSSSVRLEDHPSLAEVFPGLHEPDLRRVQRAWEFFRDAPEEVWRPIAAAIDSWLESYGGRQRLSVGTWQGAESVSSRERKAVESLLYFLRHGDPGEVDELVRRAGVFRRYEEKKAKIGSLPAKESNPGRR
jgi:transcriptional regulator with XRE-family HTH domain